MRIFKACAAVMLVALATIALAGCFYINTGEGGRLVTGSGKIGTRDVELTEELTGLVNEGSIDVVIDPALTGKAVIKGDDNLIEMVELMQDGGVVTVKYEHGLNVLAINRMLVRIPAINGGQIVINGSGDVALASGTLSGDAFDVRITGSGDMKLALEADEVSLSVNGSGDIDAAIAAQKLTVESRGSGDIGLSGTSARLDASVSGSGELEAGRLEAQDADVNLSGSGDVRVTVTGALTGSVNGSGSLVYGGSPASVDVSDNGSGDVHAR